MNFINSAVSLEESDYIETVDLARFNCFELCDVCVLTHTRCMALTNFLANY